MTFVNPHSSVRICLLLGTILLLSNELLTVRRLLDAQKDFLSDAVAILPRSSSELMTPKGENQPKFDLRIQDQQGYWIGNTWVPPKGWKLYSPEEMRKIYRNTRGIMWIGDSSARRTAATMYGILDANNTSNNAIPLEDLDANNIIDVNKYGITEPCTKHDNPWRPFVCREIPGQGPTSDFMIYKLPCFKDLEGFLSSELAGESNTTANMDLIVVASPGLWERKHPNVCRPGGRDLVEVTTTVLNKLGELSRMRDSLTIVWRTSQFDIAEEHKDFFLDLNAAVVNQIGQYHSPSFMVMDYASNMLPRSFGEARIKGDSPEHLGFDARLMSIQMLNNLVVNHQDPLFAAQ